MRQILLLTLGLMVLTACNNTGTSNQDIVQTTVEELVANPEKFSDTEVSVSGMVTHVCRHGGQKCFIVGKDGETQVRIVPGEGIDEFSIDLEGSTVAFKGTFKVMTAVEAEAHVEDHESKAHHAVEQSHSEAEKADIFLEATTLEEVAD